MIKQFNISNFKAFRNQPLSLTPLTLLTGLNGSGKSSVLQALLLLRQSFDQGLLQENQLALDGGLLRLGTRQDALFEGANEDAARIGFELTTYIPEKSFSHQWNFVFDSKDDRVSKKAPFYSPSIEPLGIFGPGFHFLSAERIGPRLSYGMADNDLASVGLGVQGEWVAQFLAASESQPIAVLQCQHPVAVANRLLNQVEAWMGEFSPGLRIEVHADPTLDSVSLRYKFEARRGVSNSFRATNVGFGISYTLPVVVAVLASHPGDLILLEAPEAHLHPRGQSKLGQLLARAASGGVQVIAETHSDHVMNGVRVAVHEGLISPDEASFLYFRWDPKAEDGTPTVRTVLMDKHGRVEDWPEGFFDEMDRSLETLPKEGPPVNDLVVNELSFRRFRERDQPCAAGSRAEACIWMSSFVQTLAQIASINRSRVLRTLEEFSYQELAPDYSLVQWRNDRRVNRDERELFRLYTTKSPLLNDVLDQIVQRERGCEAQFEGISAMGLLAAFLLDSLAVSLPSDPAWQTARLIVSILELGEDGDPIATDEIILHAASPEHVREHAPLFEASMRDLADSGRDIVEHKGLLLPNLRFCGNVEGTLNGMGPNDSGLAWVRRSLFELNDHCRTWIEGEFRHSMLRGSPTPESQPVDDNGDLRRLRLFTCADGEERYFRWRLKNKSLNLRLHYFPKNDEHIVLIGYIGPHLPMVRY